MVTVSRSIGTTTWPKNCSSPSILTFRSMASLTDSSRPLCTLTTYQCLLLGLGSSAAATGGAPAGGASSAPGSVLCSAGASSAGGAGGASLAGGASPLSFWASAGVACGATSGGTLASGGGASAGGSVVIFVAQGATGGSAGRITTRFPSCPSSSAGPVWGRCRQTVSRGSAASPTTDRRPAGRT